MDPAQQNQENNIPPNPEPSPEPPTPPTQPIIPSPQIEQTPYQPTVINPSQPSPVPPAATNQEQPVTQPLQPSVQSAPPQVNPINGGFVGGSFSDDINQPVFPVSGTGKSGKGKRALLFGGIAAFSLLLIGTGYIFGFYIPNSPSNVWQTGMNRTANEVDAFIEKLSDPAALENLTKSQLTISGNYSSKDATANIDVNSKYDKQSTDSTIGIEASGDVLGDDINLDLSLKTQTVENSIWPNIYFKIAGIKDLSYSEYLPGVEDFDNKWISVEQDFYDDFIGDDQASEQEENFTQEDIASVATDVAEVSKKYVFSNDEEFAVLTVKEFLGTEQSEGITANRYKVEINKPNAVKYCKELVETLHSNESFKKLSGISDEDVEKSKQDDLKTCDEFTNPDEDTTENLVTDEFDVWIDKSNKILHKVRLYEDLEAKAEGFKTKKSECQEKLPDFQSDSGRDYCDYYDDLIETGEIYTEYGQVYSGGNELKLFVNYYAKTNKNDSLVDGDITINIDSLVLNGKLVYEDNFEGKTDKLEINITTEPFEGEIDASEPENSTPIMEVYEHIMKKYQERYSASGASLGETTAPDPLARFLQGVLE